MSNFYFIGPEVRLTPVYADPVPQPSLSSVFDPERKSYRITLHMPKPIRYDLHAPPGSCAVVRTLEEV